MKNECFDELDHISQSYDYGIVPGSASVFHKDELSNIVKLDLTILEGVIIVIEVSEEGYKVDSCSPISRAAIATAKVVQKHLQVPFESLDSLLMAISPKFRENFLQAFQDKLKSVHRASSQVQPLDFT